MIPWNKNSLFFLHCTLIINSKLYMCYTCTYQAYIMPCRWRIRWPSIWHSSLYQTFRRETIGKMHLSCGVCFVVLHHCQLTNAVAVHLFDSVILKLCFIFLLPVKGNNLNCMQWPLIHCRLQGIIFTYANPAYQQVSQIQTESPSFVQVVVLVPDLLDVKDLTI